MQEIPTFNPTGLRVVFRERRCPICKATGTLYTQPRTKRDYFVTEHEGRLVLHDYVCAPEREPGEAAKAAHTGVCERVHYGIPCPLPGTLTRTVSGGKGYCYFHSDPAHHDRVSFEDWERWCAEEGPASFVELCQTAGEDSERVRQMSFWIEVFEAEAERRGITVVELHAEMRAMPKPEAQAARQGMAARLHVDAMTDAAVVSEEELNRRAREIERVRQSLLARGVRNPGRRIHEHYAQHGVLVPFGDWLDQLREDAGALR